MPAGQPPFRWSVFVTTAPPHAIIEHYTRELGRAPDEGGCRWGEPPERPLLSVSVFPAERTGELPPSARGRVPPDAHTVVFLVQRGEPPAPRQRYQENALPRSLSPASLLEETLAGRLVWGRSEPGPVLKAGGRVAEGLHSGREIWITLTRQGREYLLALTSEMAPYGDPVRQKSGWFRRCEFARLWDAAERSVTPGT